MRMPSVSSFFESRVLAAETFKLGFHIFIGHGISFSLAKINRSMAELRHSHDGCVHVRHSLLIIAPHSTAFILSHAVDAVSKSQ